MIVAETERTVVRHFTLDDVPPLASILADPEVMRFSVGGVLTEDGTRQFVEWCIGLYQGRGFGPWALVEKDSRALLGFCGLVPEPVDGIEEFMSAIGWAGSFGVAGSRQRQCLVF